MPNVNTDIQVVGALANYDVQPPLGQDWEVTDIGSSAWVGVPPNTIPQVDVGLYDGALGPAHFIRSTDVRGWYRPQHFWIDNNNYLRLTNPGGAGANISFSTKLIRNYGAGLSIVKSDLQTLAAGIAHDVQPPAGEDWAIHDIGSTDWLGAAPAGLPNVTVALTDGVLVATVLSPVNTRLWEAEMALYATNTNYVRITNNAGGAATVAFSAELLRSFGAGTTIVRTDLLNCGIGASVDFIPPAGEEWKVSAIAAGTWIGVAPLAFPEITAHIFDGANASEVLDSTSWKSNGHKQDFEIDHTDYMRITNLDVAAQDVGISAILTKHYG